MNEHRGDSSVFQRRAVLDMMLICPITRAPLEHPVFIGRHVFECGAVLEWLKHHSLRNPYTNELIAPDYASNILSTSDPVARRMIEDAGLLGGGVRGEIAVFFYYMQHVLALARAPYGIIEGQVRRLVLTWLVVSNVVALVFFSVLAGSSLVALLICLVGCCFGFWIFIVPVIPCLWTMVLIIRLIENRVNALVVAIAEIVYWGVAFGLLVFILSSSLEKGYVTKMQLQLLKWFFLYFSPVGFEAVNGK